MHYLEEYVFTTRVQLTDDKTFFDTYEGEKINYSRENFSCNAWYLRPSGLLTQTDIRYFQPEVNVHRQRKVLFPIQETDFPFDIFSAVFFLLSRYEEYLPHETDAYGRFDYTGSIAWQHQFLQWPQIDYWLEDFKQSLYAKFPDIRLKKVTTTFVPTYDIDITWCYLHKGIARNLASGLRELLQGKWRHLRERVEVLFHQHSDPYDAYERLDRLHAQRNLSPIYFFLLAKEKSALDKNIFPGNKSFQQLIKQYQKQYRIGIHPSVWSNTHPEAFREEMDTFQRITGFQPRLSRQHYLRFHLPQTYRQLCANGITDDYSMGYGTINGFRASTSRSFFWYDVEAEKATSLRIHPLAFMDANAYYEAQQSPAETLQELITLYERVRAVGGQFITVFHNHILGTHPMFSGWYEMYAQFLSKTDV